MSDVKIKTVVGKVSLVKRRTYFNIYHYVRNHGSSMPQIF